MSILKTIIPGLLGFLLITGTAVFTVPLVFANRIMPGLYIGSTHFGGLSYQDSKGWLNQYENQLQQQEITIIIREQSHTYTLQELGISLDHKATATALQQHSWLETLGGHWVISPVFTINESQLDSSMARDFGTVLAVPHNASLQLTVNGTIETIPSKIGEGIDQQHFKQHVAGMVSEQAWNKPVKPEIITVKPRLTEKDLAVAHERANQLLTDGMKLSFAERIWDVKPFTLRRLLTFTEIVDPVTQQPSLAVQLKENELKEYLTLTLVPEINVTPHNARFEISEGKVTQFEIAQSGFLLDEALTAQEINTSLQKGQLVTALVVHVTEPDIRTSSDIESLGLTNLLATGESDFVGSHANRIHNITVGTTRYHGVLIPPDTEFSFNALLGPVTAAAGFKPELVIKQNVTVPEFGGGLCQVSTTIFRAAVQAGLQITQRRNHAYIVKYYGQPGFDATIYPPSTDLRFKNDTPNYILIQSRLEGTHLAMEFWGTSDGREVEVVGPQVYDRKPDGSAKALLKQIVKKDGVIQREDEFYSRYRSPQLFPKVEGYQPTPSVAPPVAI